MSRGKSRKDQAAIPKALDVAAAIQKAEPLPRDGRFTVACGAIGGYFAIDSQRRPVLLLPVNTGRLLVSREVGGLQMSHDTSIRFDVQGKRFETEAIVLTCLDIALLPTFCSLALDVMVRTRVQHGAKPDPKSVSAAVTNWEQLLRARVRLTIQQELGLWGELWALDQMSDADLAVGAWQGPNRAAIDFLYSSTALECKTASQRLRHEVSQQQLERPAGDADVYICSLWVGPDPMGRSLSDLVDAIDQKLASTADFETKLLAGGYSRLDAPSYKQRYAVLEAPLLFLASSVPRVRTADPGVSGIRFTVTLDENRALPPSLASSILRGPQP